MKKSLEQHLSPNTSIGPKRILSLDGGGVRGAFTLGYLKRLETILRSKTGDPNLLLCDYYDLIGGTSTGAILAAGLAVGMSVDELVEKYKSLSKKIFGEKYAWYNIFEVGKYLRSKYNHQALEDELQKVFGNITIGSSEIKTGLCIVTKRADTNSIWPIINHPKGKFYDTPGMGQNKNILLWQAVRASSAAPTYFAPVVIDVGDGVKGAFIDGGLSTANNPALTLLMVATLKGFPFHWKFGEKNLELCSIGTGYKMYQKITKDITQSTLVSWAKNAPDMLMQDSNWLNQMILQWMTQSPTAVTIDMEVGDLKNDQLCSEPLSRYLRFNLAFTANNLNPILGKALTDKQLNDLTEMSNAKNVNVLYQIGEKAAEVQMLPEMF